MAADELAVHTLTVIHPQKEHDDPARRWEVNLDVLAIINHKTGSKAVAGHLQYWQPLQGLSLLSFMPSCLQ